MRRKIYGILGVGMFLWLIVSSSEIIIGLVIGDLLKLSTLNDTVIFFTIEILKYAVFVALLFWGLSKVSDMIDSNEDNLRMVVLRVFWIFMAVQVIQVIYPLIQPTMILPNMEAFESYSRNITKNPAFLLIRSSIGLSKYILILPVILYKLN